MATGEEDNEEDLALMAQIALGDETAFAKLVEKHQHAVIGTIAKMTSMSPDAEDLGQQVFLRIWKAAPRYQPSAKFTTFLFTITRNLVFNHTKKQARKKEHSLDEMQEDWHQENAVDPSSRPDESLREAELRRKIDQAIANLPEKQRMAVILRQQEKLPYDEIAQVLGLSIPSIKSTLFRARNSLREALGNYLDD